MSTFVKLWYKILFYIQIRGSSKAPGVWISQMFCKFLDPLNMGFHISRNAQILSTTFPQGFRISKKFGHWTLGSGGKKTVKGSEKVWRTNTPFNSLFAPTSWETLRLTVFLPPFSEVQCPIFLNIQNPWKKVVERSGLKFQHFCSKLV